MPKLYANKTWLKREFYVKGKTPEQIASEQNVSHMTIYRYLRKFGLLK